MNNFQIIKLITKYALLLSVVYAIEVLFRYSIYILFKTVFDASSNMLIRTILLYGISMVGNIVVMFFVIQDKKRFHVENRFLEILTFLYRPIGVCLLLIQVIVESKKELVDSELIADK